MVPSVVAGLRARTLRGFMLLAVQRVVSLLISVVGSILLARLLIPEVFGVYAIIGFAVGIGVIVGDLGLGTALIQRRNLDPTTSLNVAFTAHLVLAGTLGVAIAGMAPVVVRWLGLAPEAVAPLQCLALVIPLSAFRMPAVVLLERKMECLPLAIAETADTVMFHVVAVLAALAGAGVWSFVLGAVMARLAGLVVTFSAAQWRPRIRWRWTELAPILKFGIPFQGIAILMLARDAVLPTFVAALSGVAAVGFLTWAAAVAFLPLQVVSIAGKVLFPALSQLQDNPQGFAEATEKALNRVFVFLCPVAFLLLVGAEPIVRLVYGDPWMPAVPAIRLFCLCALLGGTSTVFVHALYSLGRADTVLRLNLLWTVLLWGFTLVMVPWLGFVGYALASVCVSLTGVLTILTLRRLVPVRIFPHVRVPLIAGSASALVFVTLTKFLSQDLPSLIIASSVAIVAYTSLTSLMSGAGWRGELLDDWKRMLGIRS